MQSDGKAHAASKDKPKLTKAAPGRLSVAPAGNKNTKQAKLVSTPTGIFLKYGGALVLGSNYLGGGPTIDLGGQWGNHQFFVNVAGYFGNISAGSYFYSNFFLLATTINYGYQFSITDRVRLVPSIGVGYPYLTVKLNAEFGDNKNSGGFFVGTYIDSAMTPRAIIGGFGAYRF